MNQQYLKIYCPQESLSLMVFSRIVFCFLKNNDKICKFQEEKCSRIRQVCKFPQNISCMGFCFHSSHTFRKKSQINKNRFIRHNYNCSGHANQLWLFSKDWISPFGTKHFNSRSNTALKYFRLRIIDLLETKYKLPKKQAISEIHLTSPRHRHY